MSTSNGTALGDLSTPESFFETLRAERECMNTCLEYFEIIDRKGPCEQAGACFTEDVDITYLMKGPSLVFNGRPGYVAFLEQATAAQERTAHFVGQHRFTWHDGRPRMTSYVMSWQWFMVNAHLGDLRPAEFVTIACSEDDFERVGDRWLVSRRFVQPVAGLVAIGTPPPPLH